MEYEWQVQVRGRHGHGGQWSSIHQGPQQYQDAIDYLCWIIPRFKDLEFRLLHRPTGHIIPPELAGIDC